MRSFFLFSIFVLTLGCVSTTIPATSRTGEREVIESIWTTYIRPLEDGAMRTKVGELALSYGLDEEKIKLVECRTDEKNILGRVYLYNGFATVIYGRKSLRAEYPREFFEKALPITASEEERQMMREAVACASFEEAFKLLAKK